jgi:hypothetical protein
MEEENMIDKPYFVLLNHQNGKVIPMMEDDENMAFFESEIEACECASKNPLGETFGFEVFELGGGWSYGC